MWDKTADDTNRRTLFGIENLEKISRQSQLNKREHIRSSGNDIESLTFSSYDSKTGINPIPSAVSNRIEAGRNHLILTRTRAPSSSFQPILLWTKALKIFAKSTRRETVSVPAFGPATTPFPFYVLHQLPIHQRI